MYLIVTSLHHIKPMTPWWQVMVQPRVWNLETTPVPVWPVTMIPRCYPYPCHALNLGGLRHRSRGWWNEDPKPRVGGGGSSRRPKKNCDLTDFDCRSGHWHAQMNFRWFSWSSRCVRVTVVTVLAVIESRRVFSSWTPSHWHPLNSSSEDGKETVYNITH